VEKMLAVSSCLVLCIVGQTAVSDHLPREILSPALHRGYRTAQFEWSVSWYDKWNDGLVERYVTRRAGDDLWESNLGDEDGYHKTMIRRVPPSVEAFYEDRDKYERPKGDWGGTRNALLHEGRVWYIPDADKSIAADVRDPSGSLDEIPLPFDFSIAGIALAWDPTRNGNALRLPDRALQGLEDAKFSGGYQDGLKTVSMEYDDKLLVWYLDPRQGNRPVRAEFYSNDELEYSSETDYRKTGDRLVVDSMRFYRGYDDSPSQVVEVQKATFDKPWHLQRITPSDIGALFGTQFYTDNDLQYWSGTDLLTIKDYDELVYLYDVLPDPRIVRRLAKSLKLSVDQYLAWVEVQRQSVRRDYFAEHGTRPWLDEVVLLQKPGERDEWDVYVERFIDRHKLTGEKRKRAVDILERSKKLRDVRLRKDAAKIKQARRENNKKKLAYYKGMTQRIFDEVLVRSLNHLIPKTPTKKKKTEVAGKE